jgi:hypothetical protein
MFQTNTRNLNKPFLISLSPSLSAPLSLSLSPSVSSFCRSVFSDKVKMKSYICFGLYPIYYPFVPFFCKVCPAWLRVFCMDKDQWSIQNFVNKFYTVRLPSGFYIDLILSVQIVLVVVNANLFYLLNCLRQLTIRLRCSNLIFVTTFLSHFYNITLM